MVVNLITELDYIDIRDIHLSRIIKHQKMLSACSGVREYLFVFSIFLINQELSCSSLA